MQCARWETGRIGIIVVYYDCLLHPDCVVPCLVASVACCVAVPEVTPDFRT
jgi:hypothetical protein